MAHAMTLLSPLWLVPAAALLAAAVLLRERGHGDDWHRLIATPVLAFLRPEATGGRSGINLAFVGAALAVAALSQPALRAEDGGALRHAEAWIVLVDVSRSMTLADRPPDRLGDARRIALEIADSAEGRPLALVAYAGDAYLAQPFSFDARQYRAMASALQHGLVPAEGSDVARALAYAGTLVDEAALARARLFLLTDTGGIEADASGFAARLAAAGHRLDVIVIADPETGDPVATDLAAADALAAAGGGAMVATDALGASNLEGLFTLHQADYAALDVALGGLRGQSHWLALACLPIILLLFARRDP